MLRLFRLLASFKRLRGTRLDIFGHTAERRAERALITEFETDVEELLGSLSPDRLPLAIQLAELPERIRGFGHIKTRNMAWAAQQRKQLLVQWRAAPANAAGQPNSGTEAVADTKARTEVTA